MRFTVASGELAVHLQTVVKIINSKSVNTVPVLDNILFELEGSRLTLSAADINNRLTTSLEVQNSQSDGCFIIPHRTFLEFLKDLPDQPIHIEVRPDEGYIARLEYHNGYFDFMAAHADVFPSDIKLDGEQHRVVLSALGMLQGLASTKFAASTDERRPIMTGVLMDFQEQALVYVASDGRYLVRHTDKHVQGAAVAQLCIPAAICNLLTSALLPKESGEIELLYTEKYLQVKLKTFTLTARLLDGKFPNYNAVIPPESPFNITVNREALLYGSKRVANCANKASRLILLNIDTGEIKLQSKDLDFSIAGEETLSCSADVAQYSIRIGFDSELLGQILGSLSSQDVVLSLSDQTRAGVILPAEQAEGVETLCLLIPLKLLSDKL